MKSDRDLYSRIESSEFFKPGDMRTQFSRLLADDGLSSYQFLLQPLLGSKGGTLLDLCGGSGPLSEAADKCLGGAWKIILLDASARELEEARKRLPQIK